VIFVAIMGASNLRRGDLDPGLPKHIIGESPIVEGNGALARLVIARLQHRSAAVSRFDTMPSRRPILPSASPVEAPGGSNTC
jgi:hypothetical protein